MTSLTILIFLKQSKAFIILAFFSLSEYNFKFKRFKVVVRYIKEIYPKLSGIDTEEQIKLYKVIRNFNLNVFVFKFIYFFNFSRK